MGPNWMSWVMVKVRDSINVIACFLTNISMFFMAQCLRNVPTTSGNFNRISLIKPVSTRFWTNFDSVMTCYVQWPSSSQFSPTHYIGRWPICADRPSSAWWLQIFWHQFSSRPSATNHHADPTVTSVTWILSTHCSRDTIDAIFQNFLNENE